MFKVINKKASVYGPIGRKRPKFLVEKVEKIDEDKVLGFMFMF